jgi:lipoate-protein ligase A
MLVVKSHTNDPYFNIAAEEYFLHHHNSDLLFLYVNCSSVIVGKHQNTLAETNYRYVLENKIPVIRRFSGGGAVYHDIGNLNFAFFTNAETGAQINFKKYADIIIDALKQSGINAYREGKNDIRVNGLKISGNAGHVYKNRTLHHGTLLVNADLQQLSNCLKVEEGKYIDKAVKSIRSKVVNLSLISDQISIVTIINSLLDLVNGCLETINNIDKRAIEKLAEEKYKSWQWNYGYSPEYSFSVDLDYNTNSEIIVKEGIIHTIKNLNHDLLKSQLIGQKHEFASIKKAVLSSLQLTDIEVDALAWKFF